MASILRSSVSRTLRTLSHTKPQGWVATRHLATLPDLLDPTTGLNEDNRDFVQAALQFAENELAPHAAEWDEHKIFPEEVLRAAAGMGFAGMYVREDVGGSELTRLAGVGITEALASGCTSTTAYLTIHNMVASMIDKFGTEEQRAQWLPSLLTMEQFASYCLTEPGAGSDAASLATRAVRDGDDFVLNGSKMFISGGGRSDVYLIMARTGGTGPKGISAFLVPSDAPGLSFGANERKLGWNSQPTAAVMMEDCRIPAANMLGAEGQGFTMAMMGLDGGRLSIAACSLGAAYRCTYLAREYTQGRTQFGAPLSNLQTVQFKLADMATELVGSRSMVRFAASMLDEQHPNSRAYAAMAKRLATDNCFDICNQALQLHGGYGYLRDYPIERFLRDARVHQILEGTNEVQRVVVGRQMATYTP